jgi:hypothetical protein
MAFMHLRCPNDTCRFRVSDELRGKPLRCVHCQTLLVEYAPDTPELPSTPEITSTPPERLGWFDFIGLLLLGVGVIYVVVRWFAWLLVGVALPP